MHIDIDMNSSAPKTTMAIRRAAGLLRHCRLVLLYSLALSAGAHAAGADWQAGAGPEWARIMAAAKQEGKVVVSGPPQAARALPEAFTRDTGIQLEYLTGNVAELANRMEREAKADKLTIDVALGGGAEVRMMSQGLLKPVKPQLILPGVTDMSNWRDGKLEWFDTAGEYMLRTQNYVSGFPVINTDIVKPDAIKVWKDLLKPEYRGKIAAYDPRGPGQGQAVAAYIATIFGTDFMQALYIGQKVVYTTDGRQLAEWAARGTHPIILGFVQADIQPFIEQGIKLTPIFPDDGPGGIVAGFSVLKMPQGAPHPNAATVFINWYASKPGQEAYSKVMMAPSARNDVHVAEAPPYLVPKPGVKYFDQYQEAWYVQTRPKLVKLITDALGGR
jgi:ABC-type Fe3+ transport system substrate-binding protein